MRTNHRHLFFLSQASLGYASSAIIDKKQSEKRFESFVIDDAFPEEEMTILKLNQVDKIKQYENATLYLKDTEKSLFKATFIAAVGFSPISLLSIMHERH
jgi:hypothetical protein